MKKINKLGILGTIIIFWFCGFLISCLSETNEVVLVNEPTPQVETTGYTTLVLTNNTNDTISTWLTLSGYTDTLKNYYVQNVNGIFGITDSGLVGNFKLLPQDTLTYQSTMALSGNICFGGQPINCPNTQFPTGLNIFEFTINNRAIDTLGSESVEISCVNGVNSWIVGNLVGNGWEVTKGMDTIRTFKNATLGNNTGLPGVFPTGCTNCTNQQGATICTNPALPFDKPNDKPICIISRPSTIKGGFVICTFNGFTK